MIDGMPALPTVSVVVPVYNGAAHLSEALQSVLDQRFADFELIVVDDGSTDASPTIIDTFTADPRVRVITQANAGGAAARNVGIAAAQGRFVAMLDQDDVMLPDRLADQVAAAVAEPSVLLWAGHAMKISKHGRELGVYAVGPTTQVDFERLRRRGEAFLLHGPTFFARREIFQQAGGYLSELSLVDDTDLANRVAEFGPVRALPIVMNRHRYHGGSSTFRKFFEQARLAEFVWARTAARASGGEVDLADYLASKQGTLLKRAVNRQHVRSRFHFRRAGIALAEGQKVVALREFAWSAAMHPGYFARRAFEMVSGAKQESVALPATTAERGRADAPTPAP